jgi:2-methylcitrate dehydratase PrpD
MTASVTQRLAEWIVAARYEDIPPVGPERVRERFLDSLGVAFGGMSTSTGKTLVAWIKAQEAKPQCTIIGAGFKTTPSLATLANAVAGHALEFDETATFSGHPANPLTAATLVLGEKLQASGRDAILAWMVGWQVVSQTSRIGSGPTGPELLNRGWFNQGFQPALGVAALASKLMGFDVRQTSMALGNAAAAMGGMMKHRASDTKSFIAGNAAMHGVMAAELVALGFTANENILDGEDGVARMIGTPGVDPERVLDGLGSWDMAVNGSTIKRFASCAAGHWSQDAMLSILQRRSTSPDEIEAIDVYLNDFLLPNIPFHAPQTGLQGKYSIEFDVAAIALYGKAGMNQYTDAVVRGPEAQAMMKRVTHHPVAGGIGAGRLGSRVVVRLKSGEELDDTVNILRGATSNPLSWQDLTDKFDECAEPVTTPKQRAKVVDLCSRLDQVEDMSEVAAAVAGGAA